MLIVIAIGGNALLKRGEPLEADIQKKNIKLAAKIINEIAKSHQVVITHGNGPQIGLLALTQSYPLDILGAQTQGMIGYLLQQELKNSVTVLTQVEIDPEDKAFQNPTKFIGPVYDKDKAENLAKLNHWQIKPDGEYYRRVVPSPEPKKILELDSIKHLIQDKKIVICCGGGGIPVAATTGVEAVIDKDLTGSLLAQSLNADALLILTDVKAVEENWRTPNAKSIHKITPEKLRAFNFASGSMGPKVEAACRFVEQTGKIAAIGALEDGLAILHGAAGTQILSNL